MRVVSDEVRRILEKPVLTAADLARVRAALPEPLIDASLPLAHEVADDIGSFLSAISSTAPRPIPYVREVKATENDVWRLHPGTKLDIKGCNVTVLDGKVSPTAASLRFGSDDGRLLDLDEADFENLT